MISARSLFNKTIHLLLSHPMLLLYGALVYLPFIIELWLIFIFIFTLSSLFLGPVAAILLFWPLIVFGFPTFFIVGGFGYTIYIQALLNHKPISIWTSLKLVFHRAKSAWWILPIYFLIYLVSCLSVISIVSLLAFIFVKQLVNDGYTDFADCMQRSWQLCKKSLGVLLRFIIILMGVVLLTALVSVWGFILVFFVQGILSWFAYFLIALTSAASFFLVTCSLVLCTSAVNLVYHDLTHHHE